MRFILALLFFPFIGISQERTYEVLRDKSEPRQLQIDQVNLDVSVAFEPDNGKVIGSSKIRFKTLGEALDSIWLDGVSMTFQSVILDGQGVRYRMFRKGLALMPDPPLEPNSEHNVRIDYHATPKRGIFFVGWEDKKNQAPNQIWTQGQGIDHRHWIPHVDAQNDKVITSLTISFDTAYQVISNGALKHKIEVGDVAHWNYAMESPHPSYLMMLAIGKYDDFKENSGSGIELTNYYYPQWESRNEYTYFQSTPIFNFLEDEIGVRYPWQNYKQVPVMNFQHGAMENTGATIFGDFFCVDSISFNDRNYVGVNAHELAHQWFGNLVTATHSKHHWLHEGFATYYSWLVEKEVFGPERFALLRKEGLDRITLAEQMDMAPLASGKAGSARFYEKGAWVLVMLRNEVGDKAWRKAISNYLDNHAYDLAQTKDLQSVMEEASKKDLDWFFDQWVYRPGIPNLRLQIDEKDGKVNVIISQELLENQPPYHLDIPLQIETSKGKRDAQIKLDGIMANYSFELGKKEVLRSVIPDSHFNLLATWHIEADLPQLVNAAASEDYVPFFAEPMLNHPEYKAEGPGPVIPYFASLLNQIAYAEVLAKRLATGKKLAPLELAYLKHEELHLEVIKAFLKNSNILQPELLPIAEKWLTIDSYEVKELALIRLCVSDRANAEKYLKFTQGFEGTNGHNVHITWLLLNSAFVNTDQVVKLVDYMSPSYDFMTRMNAFDAASQLRYVNYKVADHAFSTLFQYNRKLKAKGRDFIKLMIKDEKTKKPFQLWVNRNKALLGIDQLDIIERLTGLKPES